MITSGEILKNKRKALGKTVFEVSQETKIQEKYIKALEVNEFSSFDSPVFISGFIKIYGEYLDLDVDKLLALFRRASEKSVKSAQTTKQKKYSFKKLLTPQIISIASILLIALMALIYLYIQYNSFQKIPSLEILQPKNGLIVNTEEIEVSGKTTVGSILTINNVSAENNLGVFSSKIKLNQGDNIILVIAKNPKNSKVENRQQINIKYEKPAVLSEQTKKAHTVRIIVDGNNPWVQLIIDDRQKFLDPHMATGKSERFSALESVQVISGIPSVTKVYIDGILRPFVINPVSRSGTLSCTINNDVVNCDKE
ncbi:helix-turn-helix domain-containing protein [Candidatus Dojkabacteria bacterium]|jgi:hypothetical protein|nr:helix-turn-helix domain-containing protein [Candidatus Dojkabacteria bacterium]